MPAVFTSSLTTGVAVLNAIDTGSRWTGVISYNRVDPGNPGELSSFAAALPSVYVTQAIGLSDAIWNLTLRSLDFLRTFANITFEVTNGVDANYLVSDFSRPDNVDVAGIAASPGNTPILAFNVGTWNTYSDQQQAWIVLHELGHTLGLRHPFNLPAELNFSQYTMMAGDWFTLGDADEGLGLPLTPMALDIAVLQANYGAASANIGDTRYSLSRFTVDTDGGVREVGGFTIANGARIEAASGGGGGGGDLIIGNALANTLHGNGGADNLFGGSGDDTLDGGAGDDRVFGGLGNDSILDVGGGSNYLRGDEGDDLLQGGAGFNDINGNMGNDTVIAGSGDSWAVGGKDNDSLAGGLGQNLVYGNLGNDTCDGGGGNDALRGGQDNDIVRGGDGADFVSGDKGDDTMTGGDGADIFHTFGDAGLDRVTDFNLAQGDRVQLDPGAQFTLSQVGVDTIINMTGGGRMILAGVTLTSLTDGWIFGA